MSPLVLVLLATVAGLLVLAGWWIWRTNQAVYTAARPALTARRPLPTGCDLGAKLLLATGTQGTGGMAAPAGPGAASGPTGEGMASKPKRRSFTAPSRRQFLRNSWLLAWGGVAGGFSFASIAFLWPSLRGGFGAVIDVDTEENILASIQESREPYYYPNGRMYLVEYDAALDPDGTYAELTNGARVMALYQRCVHLGCKVPWCLSSQWFECPCHGSRYNRWGEYRFGPAPRGLDRFAVRVEDGRVVVDTSTIVTGPTRQVAVLQQPPEGPHCTG